MIHVCLVIWKDAAPSLPEAFAYTLKITSTHGHIRAIKGI